MKLIIYVGGLLLNVFATVILTLNMDSWWESVSIIILFGIGYFLINLGADL